MRRWQKAENSHGKAGRGDVQTTFGQAPQSVKECDLMERDEQAVSCSGSACTVYIKPFQIKTYRVVF